MKVRSKGYNSFSCCEYFQDNNVISSEISRSSAELRLSSEIYSTVQASGKVIMLTFTYNNDNLPFVIHPQDGDSIPCFSRPHIRRFLNNLKVRHRRFNTGSYKYFLCMEYGDTTHRAHYHALFFLSKDVDLRMFVDTCRDIWIYGYMFPAPNDNPYESCKIRSFSGGASYVSKYVVKDVAYYSLDGVQRLIKWINFAKHLDYDDVIKYIKDCLPRIYQSNGIGSGLVNQVLDNPDLVFSNGILNPLTKRYCPCPRYVLNKVFYDSVPAFDSRVGKSGKVLYDRVLSSNSDLYFLYKDYCLQRFVNRYKLYFDGVYDGVPLLDSARLKVLQRQAAEMLNIVNNDRLSYVFAVYKLYVRRYSELMLPYINNLDDLFSLNSVRLFERFQSDVYSRFIDSDVRVNYNSILPRFYEFYDSSVFRVFDEIISLFESFETAVSVARISRAVDDYKLKRKLTKLKYNPIYC